MIRKLLCWLGLHEWSEWYEYNHDNLWSRHCASYGCTCRSMHDRNNGRKWVRK